MKVVMTIQSQNALMYLRTPGRKLFMTPIQEHRISSDGYLRRTTTSPGPVCRAPQNRKTPSKETIEKPIDGTEIETFSGVKILWK